MTAAQSHGTDFWILCNAVGTLVAFFFIITLLMTAVRAVWALFFRLIALAIGAAEIAGQALGLLAAWPFEIALDRAEKWVAIGLEWREQRKIWRKEFRKTMPWDEFRRQMTGQGKAPRDDYADALSLLALTEPFTRQDMDVRFKRIMQGVHPDTGGSDYLAQQVATARSLILKQKGWKK